MRNPTQTIIAMIGALAIFTASVFSVNTPTASALPFPAAAPLCSQTVDPSLLFAFEWQGRTTALGPQVTVVGHGQGSYAIQRPIGTWTLTVERGTISGSLTTIDGRTFSARLSADIFDGNRYCVAIIFADRLVLSAQNNVLDPTISWVTTLPIAS
jgi:hypothetical protein